MSQKIEYLLTNTMTVAQIRAAIKGLPEDTPVVLASDYGDRNHTTQLLSLKDVSKVYSTDLKETGYSETGVALKTEDEQDETRTDEAVRVVVLG
jgi:hypothetical protein